MLMNAGVVQEEFDEAVKTNIEDFDMEVITQLLLLCCSSLLLTALKPYTLLLFNPLTG
jgi:hypothetical protein